jgi:cellulose synthase/poly-beta-1,6-N-acetylglucosamine synthase-like glycosyltransferase
MTSFLQWAFWVSAALLVYIYFGYPFLVILLSRLSPRTVRKAPNTPSITIVIPAYNEAAHIRATLENKLALDYPTDCVEIVVVSDASTDGTDTIVQEYVGPRVRLIRQEPRQGKTAGLNRALETANGEIIVFSDANSIYSPDALRHLTANFADPCVGYVTGSMRYESAGIAAASTGSEKYMGYESALRIAETRLGSVVGVNGGIDAVRRSLYRPMRVDQQPDFVLPLRIVEQGFRVVYEPRAWLYETALSHPRDEYRMRLRVTLRALWALVDMRHLLNPVRFGNFSWQLFSHKVLRYGAFVPLTSLLLTSALLAPRHPFFLLTFAGQAAVLLLAAFGWLLELRGSSLRPLHIPFYFFLLNLASLHAALALLAGKRQAVWNPRTG